MLTRSPTALPRSWDPLNQTQFDRITTSLRTQDVQALRDLAPDMGAYVNEADPTEPDWKDTFYGKNYPRLLALKRDGTLMVYSGIRTLLAANSGNQKDHMASRMALVRNLCSFARLRVACDGGCML